MWHNVGFMVSYYDYFSPPIQKLQIIYEKIGGIKHRLSYLRLYSSLLLVHHM
ncbi:hypothetical protein AD15_0534 [Escherichia coli 3-105-05_S4_C2]|nr:hypothetical protein AD15_0534 [Escherichia coli 3-105-05_S4_C2]